jgi:hypothetical protein
LILQFERWEFSPNAGERTTLVHEFQFPDELHIAECEFAYDLAAVIVHQGSADQGHYVTIVQGDDSHIEYFDLNQLSAWAFGLPAEGTFLQIFDFHSLVLVSSCGVLSLISILSREIAATSSVTGSLGPLKWRGNQFDGPKQGISDR